MSTPHTCLNYSFVATYRKYVLHTLLNFLLKWTLWTRRRKVVFRNLKQLVVVRCLLLPFSKGLRFLSFELWLYYKIPTYLPKIISFEKLKRDLFLTWMKLFQVMQGGRNLFIFFTPFNTHSQTSSWIDFVGVFTGAKNQNHSCDETWLIQSSLIRTDHIFCRLWLNAGIWITIPVSPVPLNIPPSN